MNHAVILLSTVALTVASLPGPAYAADSLPLRSVNRAGEVIDAALSAHGGAEAISALHTVLQESKGTTTRTGQSRVPGPPYDRSPFTNFNAIDTENRIFITHGTGEGGGYVFDQGTIINGDDSWQLNYRAGTAAPLSSPDYDTQSGPFVRITPALLMKQLQSRRGQSNWLGEVVLDGRTHDVITLVMSVGPALALYIDRESGQLTRMERTLPPFGQVEYRFLDYEAVDGILFNRKFRLLVNGESNLDIETLSTRVNEPVDGFLSVPASLQRVAPIEPDPLGVNTIAEGVYLAGGNGNYSLFVEVDDYLVAVGGTQVVADALKALRDLNVTRPLKYGVITHHHSDHVPGAAFFAAEGATVVAPAAHEVVVRRAAGESAERFAWVAERMTIGNGERQVVLYDMGPTPHAENILLAWIPHVGLVFEADHFPLPVNGTVPPAGPATRAFLEALERMGIEYRMIAGTHSPRIGLEADVEKARNRKAVTE